MPVETATSTPASKSGPIQSATYGDASSTVELEITRGNCKIAITDQADSTSGDITITYTLEDDRAGTASIRPLFSTTGESGTFSEMTKGTGGSAKTGLSTTATPTTFTFVWNTVTDLGIDYKGWVHYKIRAFDRDSRIGDYMESEIQEIKVDNAPEAPTITSPATGYFTKDTTPQIIGTIPDPKSGNSDLHIKIEVSLVSDFGTIEKTFESRLDQTGWVYDADDAGDWTAIPATGIPVSGDGTLIGNSWKFTIQTDDRLDHTNIYYIRAYAGGLG